MLQCSPAMDIKNYLKDDFKNDFFASIIVFLIAIPLCLGIAIASGLPPESGLISGIIGGIIVGSLSGCPLQASGPAAGLVAIVFEIIQEHGVEKLGIIILFAGILQIISGILNLGPWFRAVSPTVIYGMLAGIGVLIFASQFHVMVDDIPKTSGIENILSLPGAIYKGIVPLDSSSHQLAALIGVTTICTIVLWNFAPKSFKIIPPALVGVLAAIILSNALQYPIKYISIPENIFNAIQLSPLQGFKYLLEWEILIDALAVAFIASAETLLTTTAIGKMKPNLEINYNKEIIAQGIGNSLAGLLGALPITGVIVRSAANVSSGAKTRAATILHGIWILLFVVFFSPLLKMIPVASLAAVLVYTGYKLVDLNAIKNLSKIGRWELIIYFTTLSVIITTNLLEGILVGIVLSIIKLLYDFSHINLHLEEDYENNKIHLYIDGNATFINLPKLANVLEKMPSGKEVFIHFEGLVYIDHASLELLMSWEKQYSSKDGNVSIKWNELEARFNQSKRSARAKVKL